MIRQINIALFVSFSFLSASQTCPPLLNVFATNGPISCIGACDAVGTVTVMNGTPPYNYFWKPISVSGATITGLCQGTYTIVATDANNCKDSSSLIIFNPSNPCVGIHESFISQKNIRIYPNPVSSILNISTEKYFEIGTDIEIVNVLGQIVLKLPYNIEIDVSDIPNGYYILKVISYGNQKLYSKFVKE